MYASESSGAGWFPRVQMSFALFQLHLQQAYLELRLKVRPS